MRSSFCSKPKISTAPRHLLSRRICDRPCRRSACSISQTSTFSMGDHILQLADYRRDKQPCYEDPGVGPMLLYKVAKHRPQGRAPKPTMADTKAHDRTLLAHLS